MEVIAETSAINFWVYTETPLMRYLTSQNDLAVLTGYSTSGVF